MSHRPPVVQASPSSQADPELSCPQTQLPVAASQLDTTQPPFLSAGQTTCAAGSNTQKPASQTKSPLHLSPSSGQSAAVVQVHPLLPERQAPPLQTSPVVQRLSSSQGWVLGAFRQPMPATQASSVQGLLSSQAASSGVWTTTPASLSQTSRVQGIASSTVGTGPDRQPSWG